MKAKVFEAKNGNISVTTPELKTEQQIPLEMALSEFLAEVKDVHFITQSDCPVSHSSGSPTRYTTVTILYD